MSTEKTEKNEKKVVELKVDDILPNRFQPRIKFDEASINDLSASIKEHGVIQPLVVRKIGDKYEIIAGERRYKASVMAGLETVPVIITDLDDKDSAEVALIENVQRQNLTPIEEAVSYKKILDMGYLTQEQLALKLGKSQSSIANKLRLLNLDDEVQEALLNGQISERHARSLLKLSSSKQQVEMLNRIINERLTVRRTDEEIDKMLNDLFEADDFNETETGEGTQKTLEPEEKEDEIEHTQPLSFDFSSVEEGPKNNVFDLPQETKQEEPFFKPEQDDTNFFGFNQNIMPTNEPIKDEFNSNPTSNDFVDINQIQEQAQDIYPKEETKDINSFLEPTLLVDEDVNTNVVENGNTNEETLSENIFNNQPVQEEPVAEQPVQEPVQENDVMPIDSNNELELNNEMKPGKFFDLFNNNNAFDAPVEPVQEEPQDIPAFNPNEVFNSTEPEYNRFDDNVNVFDNSEVASPEVPNTEVESNDELKEVVPQSLEAEEVPAVQPQNEETNLNVALEKIRSYAEELKKLGIDMNIEESDFENKYQITINIDK